VVFICIKQISRRTSHLGAALTFFNYLNVPHINNRPLKTSVSSAASFLFALRAPDKRPSWRLHQLVSRIQPPCCSLWYLLLGHLGVFNRQQVRRLRSRCSSTPHKAQPYQNTLRNLAPRLVGSLVCLHFEGLLSICSKSSKYTLPALPTSGPARASGSLLALAAPSFFFVGTTSGW
jgi:hypothetical protein